MYIRIPLGYKVTTKKILSLPRRVMDMGFKMIIYVKKTACKPSCNVMS